MRHHMAMAGVLNNMRHHMAMAGQWIDPSPFAAESKNRVIYCATEQCGGRGYTRNIQDIGKSDLIIVSLPSNFFTTYMPFFRQAASQSYMPGFDGKRHLNCIETRDYGMAFMKDMFHINPKVLEAAIRVADNSMTMDRREAAVASHPEWFAHSHNVTDVSDLGETFAACSGVRVLFHNYTTEPHQGNMIWHPDDWENSFAHGEYAVATMLLPATEQETDAICTEFSGAPFAVPRGCGVWLPCNVMHRGVTTGVAPRHGLQLEFVAAGRQHNGAKGQRHAKIKDWLFFTRSMLVENRREGPHNSYMSALMPNM